jgi:hypothetical protein
MIEFLVEYKALFYISGFMFLVLAIGILQGLYEQSQEAKKERLLNQRKAGDATDKRYLGDAWDQIPKKRES